MKVPGMTVGKRNISDGRNFNKFFPSESQSYGNYSVLNRNGDVYQTVKYIAQIIGKDKKDTFRIAQYLKRTNRLDTLRNIHRFMVKYLQYDEETGEKLRSPRRTWWVGSRQLDKQTGNTGVDCDDLVIFSGTILKNLNIPFFIRIVKINTDEFQHVYLVVPKSGEDLNNGYYTVDGVISEFNYEHPFKEQKTFDMNGLKIEYLGQIGSAAVQVSAFDEIHNLLDEKYKALLAGEIVPTRVNRPDLIKMLGYALKNWDVNREKSLAYLANAERTHYPGQSFFQKLYDFATKYGTLQGDWAPDYWTPEDQALLDSSSSSLKSTNTQNGNGKNGSVWTTLSSLFNAAAKFDWGLVGGNRKHETPPSPMIQPYDYSNPNPGIHTGNMLGNVPGILLGGVVVFGLYKILIEKKPLVTLSTKRLKK